MTPENVGESKRMSCSSDNSDPPCYRLNLTAKRNIETNFIKSTKDDLQDQMNNISFRNGLWIINAFNKSNLDVGIQFFLDTAL